MFCVPSSHSTINCLGRYVADHSQIMAITYWIGACHSGYDSNIQMLVHTWIPPEDPADEKLYETLKVSSKDGLQFSFVH
jgi:hypothetical protein